MPRTYNPKKGEMPPVTVKNQYVPPKPSLIERAKAKGRGAIAAAGKLLGQVPTGYGVTTRKKGVLRAKDTMGGRK